MKLFTLANGLRLVVREDPRLPLVSMHAVFKGGLLTESPPDAGISRLFARVLPKGTTHRSAEEIAEQIEAVGGSIGADAGNNSISVSVEVLQPDVDLGLDLLAELVLDATFPRGGHRARKADPARRDQGGGRAHVVRRAKSAARESLSPVIPTRCARRVRRNPSVRSPARSSSSTATGFSPRTTASSQSSATSRPRRCSPAWSRCLDACRPAGRRSRSHPCRRALAESRTVEQTKPDKEQAVLMIGYQTVDLRHPDKLAFDVIDEACGDLGSRFFVRIREELGLAYFVGSSQLEGLAPGGMIFYLGTDPVKLTAVRAAFESEIAALARDGLTPEEFQRARKKLLGRQAISMQSNASLGFHVALDELYGRGHDHYLRLEADLQALTLERVNRVAREFFHERPNVVAVVKPA